MLLKVELCSSLVWRRNCLTVLGVDAIVDNNRKLKLPSEGYYQCSFVKVALVQVVN